MALHPHLTHRASHKSRHFDLYQIGRIVFLAILFLLFFLLAHSMVAHRFFQGGWYSQNGTIRP